MKVKNTLLFVFPIVVSACGETPEERMERIWKKVRPTWNLYRQDAKKGDYSRFLQDYKEDMKYLKKNILV